MVRRNGTLVAVLAAASLVGAGARALAQDSDDSKSAVERERSKIERKVDEKERIAKERGEALKREQEARKQQQQPQRELKVDGRVTEVHKLRNNVVVHDETRDFDVTLKADKNSQITLDGKKIALDDIPAGSEARASYFFDDKRDAFVIRNFEARSRAVGGSGTRGEQHQDRDQEMTAPREPMHDPAQDQMQDESIQRPVPQD